MQQGRCNWQCITGYLLQIQMSLELFLIRLHVPVRRYQATDTKAQATSGVNLKLFVGSIKCSLIVSWPLLSFHEGLQQQCMPEYRLSPRSRHMQTKWSFTHPCYTFFARFPITQSRSKLQSSQKSHSLSIDSLGELGYGLCISSGLPPQEAHSNVVIAKRRRLLTSRVLRHVAIARSSPLL